MAEEGFLAALELAEAGCGGFELGRPEAFFILAAAGVGGVYIVAGGLWGECGVVGDSKVGDDAAGAVTGELDATRVRMRGDGEKGY